MRILNHRVVICRSQSAVGWGCSCWETRGAWCGRPRGGSSPGLALPPSKRRPCPPKPKQWHAGRGWHPERDFGCRFRCFSSWPRQVTIPFSAESWIEGDARAARRRPATIDVDYHVEKIDATASVTIVVETPDSQDMETTFDIARPR